MSVETKGMLNTPVEDCLAVVVDPTSERYAQTGRIVFHDWNEMGTVGVRFEDDSAGDFDDGLMANDDQFPQVRIMRKDDTEGIAKLQEVLETRRGDLLELYRPAVRAGRVALGAAIDRKKDFSDIIRIPEADEPAKKKIRFNFLNKN